MRKVAGRPKKYTAAAFKRAVNRYFAKISRLKPVKERVWQDVDDAGKDIYTFETVYNELGEPAEVREYFEKPSIAGICSTIGICRDTWAEYSKDPEYADVCAAAKNEIENYLCSQLGNGKGDSGIIFNLTHNFGWKNRVEVDAGEETRKALSSAPMTMDDKLKWLAEHGYAAAGNDDDQ